MLPDRHGLCGERLRRDFVWVRLRIDSLCGVEPEWVRVPRCWSAVLRTRSNGTRLFLTEQFLTPAGSQEMVHSQRLVASRGRFGGHGTEGRQVSCASHALPRV